MIRVKSAGSAFREQSRVPSGLWNTGCGNVTSSVVMPDEDEPAPGRDQAEGVRHRDVRAGRVDHDVGQVAVGQRRAGRFSSRRPRPERVFDAHRPLAEVEPLLVHVEHDRSAPR